MPNNFNIGLETRASPNMYADRPVMDQSGNIAAAGEALASIGEAYKERKEDQYLGSFSTELAKVEEQVAEYADRTKELYQRRNDASGEELAKIDSQIQRLVRGEEQGVLSPTKARLAIDNLIKTYGSRNPSLAKDIRLMANAAKGQFNEIINEAYTLDPDTKADLDFYHAAELEGLTPSERKELLNVKRLNEKTLQNVQTLEQLGALTENDILRSAGDLVHQFSNMAYYDVVTYFDKEFKAGKAPTDAQIDGFIANKYEVIRSNLSSFLRSRSVAGEVKDIGIFRIDPAEEAAILSQAELSLKNLATFLKGSSDTWDNKVKLLKEQQENNKNQFMIDAFNDRGPLGMLARAEAFAPGLARDAFNGMISVDGMIKQHMKQGVSYEVALSRVLGFGDAAATGGDTKSAFSIYTGASFLQSGLSLKPVLDFIMGQPYKTDNPVVDSVTAARADEAFKQASQAKKVDMAPGMLYNYDWKKLTRNPDLANIVNKNGELKAVAFGMATRHVLQILNQKQSSLDGVVFDPLKLNPFQYKSPIGISRPRVEALIELNRTYYDALRMFGGDATNEWVRSLIQLDTSHGLSTTGNMGVEKKSNRYDKVNMGDSMKYVMQRNSEVYHLPEELVMAVGDRESTLGTNLSTSASSAKGPLGIIDSTFNAMNNEFFEGKLDPNDMNHRGEAALMHLADLYFNKHPNNVTAALLHYFSGSPEGWNTVDALPSQTGNSGKYLTTNGTTASWAAIITDPTPSVFMLMGA